MRVLLLLLVFASSASAQTGELRVICSNVIKAAVEQLLPAYQRESGQRVSITYGASAELKRSLEAGDSFDVALLTTGVIDELSRQGIVAASSRTGIAQANLAVGAKTGSPKADVTTADGMRRRLLDAASITYSRDGGGVAAIERMIDALGIREPLKNKTFPQATAGRAGESVAAGEYELAFAPVTEIVAAPGAQVLGLFPPEFQSPLAITAGVSARAHNPAVASAFTTFLRTPGALKIIEATGMAPIDK